MSHSIEQKHEQSVEEPPILPYDSRCIHEFEECSGCKLGQVHHSKLIAVALFTAYFLCSECSASPSIRRRVVAGFRNMLPIPRQMHNRSFLFYRMSRANTPTPVFDGAIEYGMHGMLCGYEGSPGFPKLSADDYVIRLSFSSDGETSLDGRTTNPSRDRPRTVFRTVSLSNLFRHNAWLYPELSSCDNFFNRSDFQIGWNDFPEETRERISRLHVAAMARLPDSFLA